MGLSSFFRHVWDVVRRPFTDCTDCTSCYTCYDMCDPNYYRKTSPGVRRTQQVFDQWAGDVKFDFTQSRPVSSNAPSSSSNVAATQRSNVSASSSGSSSTYSYEEEDKRQVQFLFYGGSDPPTPTSAGGVFPNGYRSDMISNYTQPPAEPRSPAVISSPHINHEMPCFFSPRNTPQSPMSAPIYSPHLFKISEHQQRRSTGYYGRYSR